MNKMSPKDEVIWDLGHRLGRIRSEAEQARKDAGQHAAEGKQCRERADLLDGKAVEFEGLLKHLGAERDRDGFWRASAGQSGRPGVIEESPMDAVRAIVGRK